MGDSHGGVIIYVKDSIHYRRRNDLELQGIESIWVQLTLKHKHVLFGLFYRPPNSDSIYYSHWLGAYRTNALYSGHIFVRFNDLEGVFT